MKERKKAWQEESDWIICCKRGQIEKEHGKYPNRESFITRDKKRKLEKDM